MELASNDPAAARRAGAEGAWVVRGRSPGAGALPDDLHDASPGDRVDVGDDLGDDLEGPLDLDDPWQPPRVRARRPRRRTVLAVVGGAVVVAAAVLVTSAALRTPQERLEDRLADAVRASGAELAGPVELTAGAGDGTRATGGEDGEDVVWTGRLQVVEGTGTATVRVALRLPPDQPDEVVPALFPSVDCDGPYPLTWPGDSDTSYRTTRDDLSECVATTDGDAVLVTIGWRDDDGDGSGSAGGGDGRPGVDRQTWRTAGDGSLVWLRSRGDGEGGLTGEQLRAVASAEGLLARL